MNLRIIVSNKILKIKNKYTISNETALSITNGIYTTFVEDTLNSISIFDINKI
ncbi:hypothetical protein ACFSJW_24715 [Flavobacterium artemisiae]|uniref:Uncharacterized protein n=1 Tax=Flavobacterium artemisiae TaxID=2126556 RepID=A0ABW4HC49_9FLAO